LKLALLQGEEVFMLLHGYEDTDAARTPRPLYAIAMCDCAQPAVGGRVDFNIPAVVVHGRTMFTSASFARKVRPSGTWFDLGPVPGFDGPLEVINGNLNLIGLYVALVD
jgi:hypothetical protein